MRVHTGPLSGGFRTSRVTSAARDRLTDMRKLFALIGSVVLSTLFGIAGSTFGIMTGFMLGMVGTGVGMYAGARLADRLGV